jgi:hypothetical protein
MLIRIFPFSHEVAVQAAIRNIQSNGFQHLGESGSGRICRLTRFNGVQVPIYHRIGEESRVPPSERELLRIFNELPGRSFQMRHHFVVLDGTKSYWGLRVLIHVDDSNVTYAVEMQEDGLMPFPNEPLDDYEIFSAAWHIRWARKKVKLADPPEEDTSARRIHESWAPRLALYKNGLWYVQRLSRLHRPNSSWRVPVAWAEECFSDHVSLPERYPWLENHPGGDPIGEALKELFEQPSVEN